MAFHFTLEAVLRLRRSLEDRELLLLQTLFARRATLTQELEQLHQADFNLKEETGRALEQPTPAVEIHFTMVRLQGISRRQQLVQTELRQLEIAIAEQRLRFETQRRSREVLEALRDEQWSEYRLARHRREQAQLDELHRLRLRALSPPTSKLEAISCGTSRMN